jgi:hypothetical protein
MYSSHHEGAMFFVFFYPAKREAAMLHIWKRM